MSLFGHFPVGCAQFLLTIHLLYTIKKWHRGPLIDRFLLIKWINIIRYIYMYILCVNIIISISMERLRLTPFLFLKSLLWLCFYCCPKTYQWATLLHRLPCFFITMNTHIVSYIVLLLETLTKALNVYSSAAENSRLQKNHSVSQKLHCPRKLLGPLFDIKKNIKYRSFC